MLLAIMLVVASIKVSAQINELKQYVAEMNKSCPVALNAIMKLEDFKENGQYKAKYKKTSVIML